MDIDTLIERQEVLVENQKQLLSAMVSTLDLMKAEKLRQEIDQEIAFDEPNKTVDQEEDPRVQKHKIIALKNGYTPEDVEEVASIYRSYYESLDEIEADLAAEGTAAFSTLTHEFGHALAHGSVEESLNTNLHQKEFEADVMSIMFCQHYGLEITDERKSHLSGHYKDWKKSDPNNFHPDKSMRKMFDLFREHSTVLDQKIVKAFPELATKLLPQELEVNSEKKKVVNKTAKRKPKKKKTPRL